MTIAAGFCTMDGILLCSDSLFMGGTKEHAQKLFGYTINLNSPNFCSLAFAFAGHENNAKMAIDDCVEAISDCPGEKRTGKMVKDLMRAVVLDINAKYVDNRPEAEREQARFDLIIGAWLPLAGGCRLFKSSGPAVLSAEPYHCTGLGAYLGDFFMKKHVSRNAPMKRTALVAIQGLAAAKGYDANCGGATQFLSIKNNGQLTNATPHDNRYAELYVNQFDSEARSLLFELGNIDTDERVFGERLEYFVDRVNTIRRAWKSGVDPLFQQLLEVMANKGFKPPKPEDHQSTTDDLPPPGSPGESNEF